MPKAGDTNNTEAAAPGKTFDADIGINKLCDIKYMAEGITYLITGLGLCQPERNIISTITEKIRQDAEVALAEFESAAKLIPHSYRVRLSGTTDD